MAAGHHNVAAVGTAASNAHFTKKFLASYCEGVSHPQVSVLKDNLRRYKSSTSIHLWSGAASLDGNTSDVFDADTKANLMVFQGNEKLTVDGVYGAASRNAMHRVIGESPLGWVRIHTTMPVYINYNDTPAGLSKDAGYKLDHSWVTSAARDTLYSLAYDFYMIYGKKIEYNDASLIDGADTPEHKTHNNGKTVDVRTSGMTKGQETMFLQLCVDHPNVSKIIFYTNRGFASSKIAYAPGHKDHFHIETCN